jgi:pimeloyl-ACP methyl ester carboxylesterase
MAVPGARIWFKVRGKGEPLLVLQGGGGTADASDGIADVLDGEYTIISLDRRGLRRSPLADPTQPFGIEQHAEDALRLLDKLGVHKVHVFGSSFGAQIGLELLLKQPERVKLLVAHEPPATQLLAEDGRARLRALRDEVLALALREGPRAALRRSLVAMGIDRDDREDDCEPPVSSREQSRDTGFLLTREVRAMDAHQPDTVALSRHARRITPAFGVASRAFYPAECALALAALLGREPVAFPGSHNGYVLRPRAFGARLAVVLREAGLDSRAFGNVCPDAEAASAPTAS